jgi:4-hydroxybenzoate polyprenyltransferase
VLWSCEHRVHGAFAGVLPQKIVVAAFVQKHAAVAEGGPSLNAWFRQGDAKAAAKAQTLTNVLLFISLWWVHIQSQNPYFFSSLDLLILYTSKLLCHQSQQCWC